jgi:hypothetical protein
MDIAKYRDIAYEEYQNSSQLRNYNHVSIVVADNRIVGIGTNKRKTHPLAMKYGYRNCELHSELDALLKVPKNQQSDLVLINFRFGPKGDMKLSKPCAKCLPWCINTFDEIYYSIPNGLVQLDY